MHLPCQTVMQKTWCPALVLPLGHIVIQLDKGVLALGEGSTHLSSCMHIASHAPLGPVIGAGIPGQPGEALQHGRSTAAAGDSEAHRHRRGARQRRSLKPSQMLISRDSLFYCSTFPANPGFPSSRETAILALRLQSLVHLAKT